MNIEEIRKNKPDGATHYWDYPFSGFPVDYYKKDGFDVYVWVEMFGVPDWRLCNSVKNYEFKPL